MSSGNICITFDESVSKLLVKFANKYFSDAADGYLIGPESIAHLTLSHFQHDKPQPRALRRDLGTIRVTPETLMLDAVVQHVSSDKGFIWFRFDLDPATSWLSDLKSQADAILRKYDITPASKDFLPHITLCRVKAPAKSVGTDAMKFKTSIEPQQMNLSIGGSDELGQLPKIYWKQALV